MWNPYAPPKCEPPPRPRIKVLPVIFTWKLYALVLSTGIVLGLEIAAVATMYYESVGRLIIK